MRSPEAVAKAFKQFYVHDDTFVAIRVLPAQRRGKMGASVVEIELLKCGEHTRRIVRFTGCRNLRIAIDFDVLAKNLPQNTAGVGADRNRKRMRDFMRSQKKDWNVEYTRTSPSPLVRKLNEIGRLGWFRIQLFGGAVDVIARDYTVVDANNVPEATAG